MEPVVAVHHRRWRKRILDHRDWTRRVAHQLASRRLSLAQGVFAIGGILAQELALFRGS
ncbi:MAG: hypothetical protein HN849_19425 [Victivallales bacterium]|jgi:primosomal protein N''|nr:hypothetical protein [Victivallales bacterium]